MLISERKNDKKTLIWHFDNEPAFVFQELAALFAVH